MNKKPKQDVIIEKLDNINRNIIKHSDISRSLMKVLDNKRLLVNEKRAISTTVFIGGYSAFFIIIAFGISIYFNWNYYISTGFIGIILLFCIHLIYMGDLSES